MKYLQDVPKETIAEHLRKLCSLGGIKPPAQGKEFVEFIQDGFARVSIEDMQKAFRDYLLGKYTIRQPQQLNVKFVSDIINEYIKDNRHVMQLKPREYKELPAPVDNSPKISKLEMAKDNWFKSKKKQTVVMPSILAAAWDELENKPEIENVDKYIEMIEDNQLLYFMRFKRERGHKAKKAELPTEIIYKAACMAYYLEL